MMLEQRMFLGARTALQAASTFGMVKVVRVLARKGADLNLANSHGMTPLMLGIGTVRA